MTSSLVSNNEISHLFIFVETTSRQMTRAITTLVWLRNDLRLHDNEALIRASSVC